MRVLSNFLLLISVCIGAQSLTGQVMINEFSAANLTQFPLTGPTNSHYPGVKHHDWIELFNAGPESVDLSGWHVSDKISNPTRFQLPAGTSLEAGGHLLLICSGYGHDNPEGYQAPDAYGYINTNFRLKQSTATEWVELSDEEGNILDSHPITPLPANCSMGRHTDGSADWRILMSPTPGGTNLPSDFIGLATKPTFSHTAGYQSGPISQW